MSTQQLLSAIVLLFLLFARGPAPSEAAIRKAVRDISGKRLRFGAEYHILPSIRGSGGGLTQAFRNGTCPLNVVQEKFGIDNGLPVRFFPVTAIQKTVRLGRDANVVFSAVNACRQSSVWTLLEPDRFTRRRYVATGGVRGNPGAGTLSNWFKIEKFGKHTGDYKLVFCPSVCNNCKVICGDIGVFFERGRRWLGSTGAPFPVMFKKV